MSRVKLIAVAICLLIIVPAIIVGLIFFVNYSADEDYMLKDYSKESEVDILMLGNFFFVTSELENTFDLILSENGKKNVNVDYLGLPYYQTSWFYNRIYIDKENREEYVKLRNGEYDIVVLSAFYTYEDEPAVGDFVDKLSETETTVILFPAENAATELVKNAMMNYDVYIANWQKSIQNLKGNHGFTRDNLNGYDSIPMSNQLAGFNGACLLYARLFRKAPEIDRTAEHIVEMYGYQIPGSTRDQKLDTLDLIATEALRDIKSEDKYYKLIKK